MRAHAIIFVDLLFISRRKNGPGSIFRDELEGIHAESVNSFIQPEFHHRVDFLTDDGVLPVEVRLLPRKIMEIPGVGQAVVTPGVAVDIEEAPSGRWFASLRVPPVIIIAERIGPRASGL